MSEINDYKNVLHTTQKLSQLHLYVQQK